MAPNEQNLRPQTTRTKEEQRRIAVMGGKASGVARRVKSERKKDLLATFGAEPITADKLREIDALLLNMTNEQLRKVAADERLQTFLRRRARLLLQPDDEKAFEVSERLIDRVAGKPKQQVDAQLSAAQPVVIKDDGLD